MDTRTVSSIVLRFLMPTATEPLQLKKMSVSKDCRGDTYYPSRAEQGRADALRRAPTPPVAPEIANKRLRRICMCAKSATGDHVNFSRAPDLHHQRQTRRIKVTIGFSRRTLLLGYERD